MRLTRKQTICDIPILKIRDYFDHIRPALISPEMISEQFDLNKEKTKELIDALLSEGYIEAAKKKGKYQLTIKGQALCVARYTNPLNKEKADKDEAETLFRQKMLEPFNKHGRLDVDTSIGELLFRSEKNIKNTVPT